MNKLNQVNAGNFAQEVLQPYEPVLVEFYTTWCPGCRQMAPVITLLEKEYRDKVRFIQINAVEEPELAERYKVIGVPLFYIFHDGHIVDTFVGGMPAASVRERLNKVLNN